MPNPPFYQTDQKLLYGILQKLQGNQVSLPSPPFYNTTHELLYGIYNSLGGSLRADDGQYMRTLYVSALFGNDATAVADDPMHPFQTIAGAISNIYFPDDLIYVMPGQYNEGNIAGNYSMWFDYGAVVSHELYTIFQQCPGFCKVRGRGTFICFYSPVIEAGGILNSCLDLECELIDCAYTYAVRLWENGNELFPHKIKAREIYSQTAGAIYFAYGCNAEVQADMIDNAASDVPSIVCDTSANVKVSNSTIWTPYFYYNVLTVGQCGTIEFNNCYLWQNCPMMGGYNFNLNDTIDLLRLINCRMQIDYAWSYCFTIYNNVNLFIDNVIANFDTQNGNQYLNYLNDGERIKIEGNTRNKELSADNSLDLWDCQNVENIIIYSSGIVNIPQIYNAPLHHSFKILPAAGAKLIFVSANANSSQTSDIILNTQAITIDGDNGDWIEFRNGLYGWGNRQVNVMNYKLSS